MTITSTSNQQRVTSADTAISAYRLAKGGDQSPEEWLIDLMTDLRHHAAEQQLDFAAAVRISEYHFEEESQT